MLHYQSTILERQDLNSLILANDQKVKLRKSRSTTFEDQKLPDMLIDTSKDREQNVAKELDQKTQLTSKDLEEVIKSIINRTKFKYGIQKMIDYIFRCICLRRKQSIRIDEQNKVHFLFKKGKKKLKKELDVIKLLKSLRKFKLLQQALLPQKGRVLLQYQRFNLIETDSSSSDSDDDKKQITTLMESKNLFIRLIMYGKIKSMMNQFLQNVQPLEYNLIKGVFKRRLNDFSEKTKEVEHKLKKDARSPSKLLVLQQYNSKKIQNFGQTIEQKINQSMIDQSTLKMAERKEGILKQIESFKFTKKPNSDYEKSDSDSMSQPDYDEKNEYGVEDIQLNREQDEEEIKNNDTTIESDFQLKAYRIN
ncbi:UNKNOWN [Stylonychia lemnae]|uniref:Uncharacterized protein n=1 Tax=Stylonychia lemnae TaxID=5949 RepID=A0A078BC72_STYLE|nr:UNKNOWN [Stylonychia lemnae]|eukprot:CDW90842.1 UNKNOWN [Stylonychia lemnae]